VNADIFPFLQAPNWTKCRAGCLAETFFDLHSNDADCNEWLGDSVFSGPLPFRGIGLIGLADDEGVRLNNGRPGARDGPRAIRQALANYGQASCIGLLNTERGTALRIVDAGDLIPGRDLTETHDRVTASVRSLLELGLLPIGVGGGHDLTFPLVRAVAAAMEGALHGVYFDAHLDVRESLGSGMPFRRIIEHCNVASLHCLGMNRFANSADHVAWFLSHHGHLETFSAADWPGDENQFVSIDLDVLDVCHAPGVSAVNPAGLSASTLADYAVSAGRCSNVGCFDIMELCPTHDEDGRTARVAAHLLLCFISGCQQRGRNA